MSKTSTGDDEIDDDLKDAWVELANSDRDTAPVYRAAYKHRFGEEP